MIIWLYFLSDSSMEISNLFSLVSLLSFFFNLLFWSHVKRGICRPTTFSLLEAAENLCKQLGNLGRLVCVFFVDMQQNFDEPQITWIMQKISKIFS